GDMERLVQGRRYAQRHLRAAGDVPGQPAADISAIPGVRRTAVALVDDNRCHRSLPLLPPLEHDPEKWVSVFPHDKRGTRLRGDHAQTINESAKATLSKAIAL